MFASILVKKLLGNDLLGRHHYYECSQSAMNNTEETIRMKSRIIIPAGIGVPLLTQSLFNFI